MLISSLAGIGGSAAAGALNNKKKTTTTQPIYTPGQTSLQNQLLPKLSDSLNTPPDLAPMKTAAIGGVNRTYKGAGKRLEKNLTSRGMGAGGQLASGMKDIELGRAGAIGGVEQKFSEIEMDQKNAALERALRFAFAGPGQSTTQPGNMLGGGLSNALETATLMMALNGMLGGDGRNGPGNGIDIMSGSGDLASAVGSQDFAL
jgi:hypothetical protein